MKIKHINLERRIGKEILSPIKEAVHEILSNGPNREYALTFLRSTDLSDLYCKNEKIRFEQIYLQGRIIQIKAVHKRGRTGSSDHYMLSIGEADNSLRKAYPRGAIADIKTGEVKCGNTYFSAMRKK